MAWNRPTYSASRGNPKKRSSAWRGAVAGVCVAVAAGSLLWLWAGRDGEESEPRRVQKKSHVIKERKPSQPAQREVPTTKAAPGKPKEDIRTLSDGRIMKYHPDGTPAWNTPRIPRSRVVVTNDSLLVKTPEEKVFSKPADIEIAWLLNTEPGEQVVGDWNYRNFNEKFLAALDEPIKILPEDDEETVMLKKAVIEVREDFKKRHAQGEDLAETMAAARKELQEVGMYREELKEEIRKIVKDDVDGHLTEKDCEELIQAANLMLEERGARPVSMPAFIKYRFEKESMEYEND